jgi:hypothetical protein
VKPGEIGGDKGERLLVKVTSRWSWAKGGKGQVNGGMVEV